MSDKGLNLFDECAAEMCTSVLLGRIVYIPFLPEGTIKCTHVAP